MTFRTLKHGIMIAFTLLFKDLDDIYNMNKAVSFMLFVCVETSILALSNSSTFAVAFLLCAS